jgi:hypothetical protein
MDRAELETFEKIARWSIASYAIAMFIALALGLDPVAGLAG